MKELGIFIFVVFFNIQSYGSNYYQSGDTMYVWAQPYLNLRSEKSNLSEVRSMIPYGEKVVVLETKIVPKFSPQDVAIDPFKNSTRTFNSKFLLEGNWVKVKFNDKEGFILDIYISKLPPIDLINDLSEFGSPDILKYLKRTSQIINYEKMEEPNWEGLVFEKWTSSLGIIYSRKKSGGRSDEEVILSGVSKEEGYMFLQRMDNFIMRLKERINSEEYVQISGNHIAADLEGGGFSFYDTEQSIVINRYYRD